MIQSRIESEGVVLISLNRPDKRNAMTPDMFAALRAAIFEARTASAVILTGTGPVFCGGFDLKMCLDTPGTLRTLLTELAAAMSDLRALDIPVVIAAHGAAIAGGCALLGAADYTVTNDDARLGYPVVKLGISPAVSAPYLRRLVGDARSRARMLDIDLISGKEAARIGLAHESVAHAENVLPRALEVARTLASKPGIGFAATKRWLRELEDTDSRAHAFTDFTAEAAHALEASLSIEGQPEERQRLAAMFQAKASMNELSHSSTNGIPP